MIIKSYEVKNTKTNLLKNNFFLLYGENLGLKKDIKNFILDEIKKKNKDLEVISLFENEILNNENIFFDPVFSGSLFSQKKTIIVYETTDKILKKINTAYDKYPDDVFLIFFSDNLDKKSKLRNFFEKGEKTICVPSYLDSEKDLETIALIELKKNNIAISRECVNLLVEKSNSDRNNLRNEMQKIIAFCHDKKKIDFDELRSLINFSGDYKSDIFINECLCGNISEYKKIVSQFYVNTVSQILLLRILSNKIHRLLKIKELATGSKDIENIINNSKPMIFWKEKPLVKKQLQIWNLKELKKIIHEINNTELLCKQNPNLANNIFLNFFSSICKKANNAF